MATGHSRPGSTPTAGDFEFGTLAIPLTLLCQCLSDETLKAVGPFYLVSMPPPTLNPPVCDNAALDAALHSIRRRRRHEQVTMH